MSIDTYFFVCTHITKNLTISGGIEHWDSYNRHTLPI